MRAKHSSFKTFCASLTQKLTISNPTGGFWVTAMDVLTEQQGWWNMRELDPRTRDEVLPFVEAKLAEAHKIQIGDSGERGVHEDCREQNIFIRCERGEAVAKANG